MDIQGWVFLLLDVFWTSVCGYGDLYVFPGEHVCTHVSACRWVCMGGNVYMLCHGVCPSWEHLWNLGHPGWPCTELVKWLRTKVATPWPKQQLACSLEKGKGQS